MVAFAPPAGAQFASPNGVSYRGTPTILSGAKFFSGPDPWFDVRAWGAAANDSGDDSAAVQRAVDSAVSLGGGRIYLPRGLYRWASTVLVTGPVFLFGAGMETTTIYLNDSANCSVLKFGVTSAQTQGGGVSHLCIDGNKANQGSQSKYLIHLAGQQNVTVSNCRLKNADHAAIYGESSTGRAAECFVHDNYIIDSRFHGIQVVGGTTTAWSIQRNFVGRNGQGGGVSIATGMYFDTAGDMRIIGNILWENSQTSAGRGIYITGGGPNQIIGNGFNSNGKVADVELLGGVNQNTIIGNYCFDTGYPGTTGVGVLITESSRNRIVGNDFVASAITPAVGIKEVSPSDHNVIAGNTVYAHTAGIVRAGSNTVMSGNHTPSCGGNTGDVGLHVPTATVTGTVTFTGATISGGTYSGPTLSGTVAGSPTASGNWTFSGASGIIIDVAGGIARLAAATTDYASLRVPHGTAPTSPTNGDHWTTTAGSFYRINGTTRQLATLDGTETLTNKTYSGGTISGTVAGSPTVSGNWTFSATGLSVDAAGLIRTGACSSSQASLRLPHGTAPSAPVDGDVWTTTAGLYVRVNGATVGPLS